MSKKKDHNHEWDNVHGATTSGNDVEDAAEAPEVTSAFLIVIRPDGSAYATSNLDTGAFKAQRTPNLADMRRACHDVLDDVNALHVVDLITRVLASNKEQQSEGATDDDTTEVS